MADLSDFTRLASAEHGLSVVSTLRADGTIQASVVNAGVLEHPLSGVPVVGAVFRGGTRKLANLRARPQVTAVARSGWQWITVEGRAELIGPDDPLAGIDPERLRLLLREIFTAAGGTHGNWDEYDRAMAAEHRTAALITPTRTYTNPG